MELNKACERLTDEIIEHFMLPKEMCFRFIEDRIRWAYAMGYDKGRSQLKHRKPVVQLFMNGSFVKEWGSSREAGKALRIDPSAITAVCRKRKRRSGNYISAGKFKWMYADEYYKSKEQEREDHITDELLKINLSQIK